MTIDFTDIKEKVFEPSDFFVIVALDYEKQCAWHIKSSDDFLAVDGFVEQNDLLDDSAFEGVPAWLENAVPGLWKLHLTSWSEQGHEGEWDGGWRICDGEGAKPELLVAFPEVIVNG